MRAGGAQRHSGVLRDLEVSFRPTGEIFVRLQQLGTFPVGVNHPVEVFPCDTEHFRCFRLADLFLRHGEL